MIFRTSNLLHFLNRPAAAAASGNNRESVTQKTLGEVISNRYAELADFHRIANQLADCYCKMKRFLIKIGRKDFPVLHDHRIGYFDSAKPQRIFQKSFELNPAFSSSRFPLQPLRLFDPRSSHLEPVSPSDLVPQPSQRFGDPPGKGGMKGFKSIGFHLDFNQQVIPALCHG